MDSSQEWYGYTDDLSEVTSTVTMYLPDRDPEDFGRKKGKVFKFCLVFSCLVLFCFVFVFVLFCFVLLVWFGLFWFVLVCLFVSKMPPFEFGFRHICFLFLICRFSGVICRFEALCISQFFRRKKHPQQGFCCGLFI